MPQFEPVNCKKSKTTSSFISLFHFVCSASDTDDNHEVLMAGRRYLSIQEFASAIPNHLLLGSLLEHLCFVYESNPARSRMLFKGMYWDEVTAGLKNNTLYIYTLFCCISFSHWPAFSRHEPPLTFGRKWWVQHRQTAAQPGLHWAASCCQLLAVSTGNKIISMSCSCRYVVSFNFGTDLISF